MKLNRRKMIRYGTEQGGRRFGIAPLVVAAGLVVLMLVALMNCSVDSSEADYAYPQGWQTVFSETFDSGIGSQWTVTDTSSADEGQYFWATETFTSTSSSSGVWCVGGGADGTGLTAGTSAYVDNADSWLIYGPIGLDKAWDAQLQFDWWLDTDGWSSTLGWPEEFRSVEQAHSAPPDGDWLGWCVLTDINDLDNCRGTYVSGSIGKWLNGAMSLKPYLPATSGVTNTIWIAFHFASDDDGVAGRGAFLDSIALRINRGHKIALPLVRRDPTPTPAPTPTPTPMPTPTATPAALSVLQNGDFEADWGEEESHRCLVVNDGALTETVVDNIHTPPGWVTWFRHIPREWDQPEVRDAWVQNDPRRVHSGQKATLLFTFHRKHDAGFLQQVPVQTGTHLRVTAFAHAWSNSKDGPHPDDGRWSEGAGYDCFYAEDSTEDLSSDLRNFTFWLGIDPTGGRNPRADTVVWGQGAHIYNCYYQVPAVEAKAQSDTVTVFLRSRTLWPFKHNDAYWDDVELVTIGTQAAGWDYDLFGKGSRLGVHAIHPGTVLEHARDLASTGAGFPVVKVVDDLSWLTTVKEISPETVTLGRVTSGGYDACPHLVDAETELDEMASRLIGFILDKIASQPRLRDAIDYWEVVNEPDPPGADGYRRLSLLMIKCMAIAERQGLRLAVFSLNNGTPEWNEMEAMVDTGVFARAKEGGHILALHEGVVWPGEPIDLWWWDPDNPDPIPGAPAVEGAGPLCFRYRYLYRLLEERDEVIPLVISEWYCNHYADEGETPEDVVEAVQWYDERVSQDYWVWGFCPFTVGPTAEWKKADYTFAYPDLVDHMLEVRSRQNALPPAGPR